MRLDPDMKKNSLYLCMIALVVGITAFAYKNNEPERSFPPAKVTQDRAEIDRENQTRITSFADILDDVTPAVVSVSTARVVNNRQQQPRSLEDFLRHMYGMPPLNRGNGGPDEQMVPQGIGSGFLVSADGYVLTNHHVVAGDDGIPVDKILVQLTDTREFEAELVGSDPQTDVAVLKIDSENLPFLSLASSENLRVGDIVFAAGNPLNVGLTVTQGIVSAVGRTDLGILGVQGFENFIQTDAAINMGNSGGPLVDADGRVVGINAAIISRSGGSIGIGFAIPIDLGYSVMNSLVNEGEVRRGFLGVFLQDLNVELAQKFGVEGTQGALIGEVSPGMPAAVAGVENGDLVTHLNGKPVYSVRDLRYMVAGMLPGTRVTLDIIRITDWKNNQRQTLQIDVVLGDREKGLVSEGDGNASAILEGVTLTALDTDLRDAFEISDTISGVLVSEVERNSPYASSLRRGMVIVDINGAPISDPADVSEHIKTGEVNVFRVNFKGRYTYIPVKIK